MQGNAILSKMGERKVIKRLASFKLISDFLGIYE